MALFNPFKRQDAQDTAASATPADQVAQARRRARQRLAGAVVLLGLGIVGFPLLFETAPRPIPVDLPIEVPRKDGLPPLQVPTARGDAAAPGPNASPPAVRGQVTAEAPAEPAVPAPEAAPADAAARTTEAPKAVAAAASVASAKPPASAAAAGDAASAAGKPRYIVQVGAYAEPSSLQEARGKVEKLGLKTYTQVVDTDGGKRTRVRVGPFGSKDEADKAAARLKAAGLPVAVLAL